MLISLFIVQYFHLFWSSLNFILFFAYQVLSLFLQQGKNIKTGGKAGSCSSCVRPVDSCEDFGTDIIREDVICLTTLVAGALELAHFGVRILLIHTGEIYPLF